jgi:CelD/BcsL family acetyltransferase involved in cellulose biosynthesis
MIRIEEIRDWRGVEPHAEAWNALVPSSGGTVFQTFEWHAAWWSVFGGDYELRVLLAWDGTRLAAVAPWAVSSDGRELQFLGSGDYASDYCDFPADPACPEAIDAFADWMFQNRRAWRRVDFRNFPSHSSHRPRLEARLRQRSPWVVSEIEADAPTRVLGNADADREVLNKSSLKRHFKHFARAGRLEFVHLGSEADVAPLLEPFFRQHIERRALAGGKSQFLDAKQKALYRELVRRLAPRGWLRFGVVRLDGEPIAFHLGFEYGARFIWYKPAFSALHAKRSPGEVLLRFLLEDAVARGLAEFDFTVGNDTFKYRFANRVRTNHRIRVYSLPTGYWLRRARKLAKRILRPARSRAASAASGDAPLGAACASGRPAISRAD